MDQAYIVGIDIGTGSTKAVAVGAENKVLGTAQHFYSATTEGDKTEQDVAAVLQAFQQSIREIVSSLGQPPVAVSLSSAMHSILAVGKNGEPLTGAMLWSDTRSSKIAEDLRASTLGERIYLATGTPLHSMSPLCKIKWLQEAKKGIFDQASKFISIKEFIWARLFDEYVIDHSIASATGLFDVLQLKWDEEALAFAGINSKQLSKPVQVAYSKTGVKKQLAESMSLPAETTFIVGASDGVLANLGSLCLSPTEAAITVGTSAAVRVTSQKPVQNPERMIFNYLLDEKTFVCGGAVNNGGNVFQWLLENLFAKHREVTNYEQLFGAIAGIDAGSNGLLFLPYLHGERAPIWDERSSGAYVGAKATHTLFHFASATAEGVCFGLNHILSSMEEICGGIEQLTVSGGLVHSDHMMQMLANVTGRRVVVQQTEDASALGAVYLAQKALGMIEDYHSIQKSEAAVFQPQPDAVKKYSQLFTLYKNLYPLLKEQMHLLHQLALQ